MTGGIDVKKAYVALNMPPTREREHANTRRPAQSNQTPLALVACSRVRDERDDSERSHQYLPGA